MKRVYNFSAGPSVLPESVLKTAADEMLSYHDSGQSVMEMSHRSKIYISIIEETENLLRKIMSIPKNYHVLFLQGGASSQFAMVPLNLMNKNNKADFVITGQWANKAYKEASRYGKANIAASSKDKTFSYIPKLDENSFSKDADYFHICLNNTIYGTKFNTIPNTGEVPLVADISSCILSEPIDVSKFGILYAVKGGNKNAISFRLQADREFINTKNTVIEILLNGNDKKIISSADFTNEEIKRFLNWLEIRQNGKGSIFYNFKSDNKQYFINYYMINSINVFDGETYTAVNSSEEGI